MAWRWIGSWLCLLCVVGVPTWARAEPGDDLQPVGVWPLTPVPAVVRAFDPPAERWGAGHRGVDLLGATGQPVQAALSGTIRFAGPLAGKQVVVVEHGGTRTTYEPVLPGVRVGDAVAAGATIGTLAGAPSHCTARACLHWGWRRGEEYLDPLALVEQPPIRLLPPSGRAPSGRWVSGPGVSEVAAARSAGRGLGRLLGSGAGMGLTVGGA